MSHATIKFIVSHVSTTNAPNSPTRIDQLEVHQKRVYGHASTTNTYNYTIPYELYESLLDIRLIVQSTTVDRQQRQSTIVEQ